MRVGFFPAPVQEDGKVAPAPKEAVDKLLKLRKDWLPTAEAGKNEVPEVKLTPVFKTQPTGWKVETAVRTKPNTTANKAPFKNN